MVRRINFNNGWWINWFLLDFRDLFLGQGLCGVGHVGGRRVLEEE